MPSAGGAVLHGRMLRHLLLMTAVAFAGVFWASCHVRYADEAGDAPQSNATIVASPGAAVPLP